MKIDSQIVNNSLKSLGFASLNQMQEVVLKMGLKNDQLVLYSPTGTGKTLAYLLISLHYFQKTINGIQAMVIVPSRELALQIELVFRKMNTGWKVNSCYGGHSIKTEINNFKESPALLIGTPGRIADHLKRERFTVENIQVLILDEFDKSLELGFGEEMRFILGKSGHVKKRILTSATLMEEIPEYTGIISPSILNGIDEDLQPKHHLKAVRAKGVDKLEVLMNLILHLNNNPALIFCNHRETVERISKLLQEENIVHDIYHGGLDQEERERAIIKLRNGSTHFLITTDLAARGLDIPEIQNVIHYQLPSVENVFVHRNGRTARMRTKGNIWLILSENESLPSYLGKEPEIFDLPENPSLLHPPKWITLYFGGGKKDKIGKIDIVGFLIHQGMLEKEDIGMITIQDYSAFAAINRDKVKKTLQRLRDCKIKGRKIKIALSD